MKTSLGDIDIELWPKEAPKVRFNNGGVWADVCMTYRVY